MSTFKKGDRVRLPNGQHATVVDYLASFDSVHIARDFRPDDYKQPLAYQARTVTRLPDPQEEVNDRVAAVLRDLTDRVTDLENHGITLHFEEPRELEEKLKESQRTGRRVQFSYTNDKGESLYRQVAVLDIGPKLFGGLDKARDHEYRTFRRERVAFPALAS